jgi:hypothetical protein
MSKISIATIDRLKPGNPAAAGESVAGGVRTEEIFGAASAPLHARYHHMPAGSTVTWTASANGHLAYVWQGAVTVGATRLDAGSMFIVEHRASAWARSDEDEAVLLVFNRPADAPVPALPGGHVHILPANRVPRVQRLSDRANVGAAIFADSACPGCELWLHESSFHDAYSDVAPHWHNEDEIIVVTGGTIQLGQRSYGPGTAIAVAKDVIYGFRTGAEGVHFINFRPSHPTYRTADVVIDEQALYRDKLGRPPYLEDVIAEGAVSA